MVKILCSTSNLWRKDKTKKCSLSAQQKNNSFFLKKVGYTVHSSIDLVGKACSECRVQPTDRVDTTHSRLQQKVPTFLYYESV